MKRIALILQLLTIAVVQLANLNGFTQEQATAPKFRDGDFWRFRAREWDYVASASVRLNGTYDLHYSGGRVRGFLLDSSSQNAEELRGDGREFTILNAMLGRGDIKLWQIAQFPLFVGKKWEYQYRIGTLGSRASRYTRSAEIRVSGIEQIATPAGQFRVFRIEKEDWFKQNRWVTTAWYSPDTKSIVKFFYDTSVSPGDQGKTELELIKFGTQVQGTSQ